MTKGPVRASVIEIEGDEKERTGGASPNEMTDQTGVVQ
jgi:hypothetical protein